MAHSVKGMSFNIRYSTAEDGENRWERRKTLVVARIRAFDPDLLGLQECRDDAQAAYLKRKLPGYQFVGVQRGGAGESDIEMAPVLYKRSAFEELSRGHFWLSRTPRVAGSKSWESLFPRTVTWVALKHTRSGKVLAFANTHFDYASEVAITASARLLRRWVCQVMAHCPVIVTGDFNASKDTMAYAQLTSGGMLEDVFRRANPAAASDGTYHAFGAPGVPTAIDWILATNGCHLIFAQRSAYRLPK